MVAANLPIADSISSFSQPCVFPMVRIFCARLHTASDEKSSSLYTGIATFICTTRSPTTKIALGATEMRAAHQGTAITAIREKRQVTQIVSVKILFTVFSPPFLTPRARGGSHREPCETESVTLRRAEIGTATTMPGDWRRGACPPHQRQSLC